MDRGLGDKWMVGEGRQGGRDWMDVYELIYE